MSPMFTIGLPTYNRANWLKDAITSALQQTYKDFELIIADNASTDNTRDVVKGFSDPRIRYHRHNSNLGAESNITWTIEKAMGTYYVLLQDDDLILPAFLSRAKKAFSMAEGVKLYGASLIDTWNRNYLMNAEVHTPPLRFELFNNMPILVDGGFIATSFLLFTSLVIPAVAIRLDCLKDNMPFDKEPFGSDRILLAKIACEGDVVFDPVPLAVRYSHKMSAAFSYVRHRRKESKYMRLATCKILNILRNRSIDWEQYLSQILEEATINQVAEWMESIVVRYNYPKPIRDIFIDVICRRTGASPIVKAHKVRIKYLINRLKL